MAFKGSKGWYVQELKKLGINKHPIDQRKIELYKTYLVRNLYLEKVKLQRKHNNIM
ncbi:YflJ family protein [Neobacillus sp. PS3-34]|uniref:YflJ family protein n=1 Tax=Neobacillus sp. PS3-34 TaxID=3070678 RepID=UPI0027E14453|nr:YflJ family protein [Neobacillus sp. PS3-34]WML47877.1 YflJ family protein [Neobacillus sp. PS3-34]